MKHVASWLERCQPDVLVLQEIKCETAAFPALTYHGLGYQSDAVGQKAYNGVAVLSRLPFSVQHRALPGLPIDDAQSRYIEIEADGITIIGIYLPNGNSGGEARFAYKLAWLDRLAERAEALLESDTPFVIAGDFNVCPADEDFAPGTLSASDALVRPESRARFRRLLRDGLTDAVRVIRTARSIRSGTIRQARGSATAVCGSTTHCCRPRLPSASSPRRRIGRNAAGRSRRITSLWWLNCADRSTTQCASAPVGRDPDVAVAIPLPVPRKPVRVARSAGNPVAAVPDVAIAVPMPSSRLPVITVSRRRHRLNTRFRYRTVRNRRLRHRGADAEPDQNDGGRGGDQSLHHCISCCARRYHAIKCPHSGAQEPPRVMVRGADIPDHARTPAT